MSNVSKGKFAFGAVIGAAAGIIAGILTAPKAGKDTRADLRVRATELKDEAIRRSESARQRTQRAADDLKQRSSRAIEAAKKEFTDEE